MVVAPRAGIRALVLQTDEGYFFLVLVLLLVLVLESEEDEYEDE